MVVCTCVGGRFASHTAVHQFTGGRPASSHLFSAIAPRLEAPMHNIYLLVVVAIVAVSEPEVVSPLLDIHSFLHLKPHIYIIVAVPSFRPLKEKKQNIIGGTKDFVLFTERASQKRNERTSFVTSCVISADRELTDADSPRMILPGKKSCAHLGGFHSKSCQTEAPRVWTSWPPNLVCFT